MKFNFEMPRADNPQEAESKKDEQSVLERLYKSKGARAVAFAAALFGAGEVAESVSKHLKNEAEIVSAVEKDSLKLEGLADKFKTEIQVEGGDQIILHIAQKHTEGALKKLGGVEDIIKSQRHVEELLVYLKEKGIADTVYEEGVNEAVLQNIYRIQHTATEDMLLTVKGMKDPTYGFSEETQANSLYAAKCELLRRANELDSNYQLKIKSGFPQNPETESLVKKLRADAKEIGDDELIHGDNVYVWGAGPKMYAEGKINLRAAQNDQADAETMAPYTLKEIVPTVLNAGYKPAIRHAIRENAALDLIAHDAPTLKEKIIPLIYGAGHDFTGAVKDWDKKAGSQKFGLTRVEAK